MSRTEILGSGLVSLDHPAYHHRCRAPSIRKPDYLKAGRGRRPTPLSVMLRIHFMQHWFGYSDPAMEEALHDIPLLRQFAGLDAFEDTIPDETTITVIDILAHLKEGDSYGAKQEQAPA